MEDSLPLRLVQARTVMSAVLIYQYLHTRVYKTAMLLMFRLTQLALHLDDHAIQVLQCLAFCLAHKI